MSTELTHVLIGIALINLGFLYIFSAMYQWRWFYAGPSWSPYYILGHDMTMTLFKGFGGLCYACGFIFVGGTLAHLELWLPLAGLLAHSAAMIYAGTTLGRKR